MLDTRQWGTYVQAKDHLPVTAWVRGFPADALVLGWSGQMVHIRWSDGPGLNHLGWVPAADVERQAENSKTAESG